MNHTKGPWRHSFSHDKHVAEIYTEDNKKRIGLIDCHSFDECKANAHLIAAAPEMLEALQIAVAQLDRLGEGLSELGFLKQTIKKAKGEL